MKWKKKCDRSGKRNSTFIEPDLLLNPLHICKVNWYLSLLSPWKDGLCMTRAGCCALKPYIKVTCPVRCRWTELTWRLCNRKNANSSRLWAEPSSDATLWVLELSPLGWILENVLSSAPFDLNQKDSLCCLLMDYSPMSEGCVKRPGDHQCVDLIV